MCKWTIDKLSIKVYNLQFNLMSSQAQNWSSNLTCLSTGANQIIDRSWISQLECWLTKICIYFFFKVNLKKSLKIDLVSLTFIWSSSIAIGMLGQVFWNIVVVFHPLMSTTRCLKSWLLNSLSCESPIMTH